MALDLVGIYNKQPTARELVVDYHRFHVCEAGFSGIAWRTGAALPGEKQKIVINADPRQHIESIQSAGTVLPVLSRITPTRYGLK